MMLRRSVLAVSRRRSSIGRIRQGSTPQIFSSVCPRREFSSVPSQNASPSPGSTGKPTDSGKSLSKVIVGTLGGAAIGACFYAAYSRGYLDDILGKKRQSHDLKVDYSSYEKAPEGDGGLHVSQNNEKPLHEHTSKDSETLNSHVKDDMERTEEPPVPVGDSDKYGESDSFAKDSSNLTEEIITHLEQDLPKNSDEVLAKGEELSRSSTEETTKGEYPSSQKTFEDSASSGEKVHVKPHEADENLETISDIGLVVQENYSNKDEIAKVKSRNEPKDILGPEQESSISLMDTYQLKGKVDDGASTINNLGDASVSKDGKLILDFLQAIHAAEQRQAELDARVFAEELRAMKEKYEKEMKDARARELMYAEEAAMLEKEINKERAKAAAALKSLQERAEERLKRELEEKEREEESKLKEIQEFSKAELAALIAREKAAQIEKMAEANLNISALCMAFYARSEEARQTHSIHKLALGALALEDALSSGLPVQSELDALHVYIENVDKDSLLQLALSSIPEDVRLHGTDTLLQLNQKFDALRGKLRHFSLIPPDGGGILAHSLAHVASFLKVKEADQSGDGIESVLNKVESLLAQGKLAEAADVLEDGVKDSKATEVVGDWLTRARNRAITEQALALLQSYAASISLT